MRLFRKMRRSLVAEGKILRYLKYAFGEVVLVVIGILIALQINNQNQNRIIAKNEHTYLVGLKEEFITSKNKLEELMAANQKNYDSAVKIWRCIHEQIEPPSEADFSALLYRAFADDISYNPNNSLLLEMINSGNLKNLSNPELRKQLTNWMSNIEDIAGQEMELSLQRTEVLDMFRTKDHSLNTIFADVGVYESLGLPIADDQRSNLGLLHSTEFENNVLMFMITCHATENAHYIPLLADLNSILKRIDEELS